MVAADHRPHIQRALAFLFARHAAHAETCWPTEDLARTVGLAGNRSKLWLSLASPPSRDI